MTDEVGSREAGRTITEADETAYEAANDEEQEALQAAPRSNM
ncbi:MAG: hypothetical protein WA156_00585 [Methylocystis silviterrae]